MDLIIDQTDLLDICKAIDSVRAALPAFLDVDTEFSVDKLTLSVLPFT